MGISRDDFDRSTVGEAFDFIAMYRSNERSVRHEGWEQIRRLFWWWAITQSKKARNLKPQDVEVFPWEPEFLDRLKKPRSRAAVKQEIDAWTEKVIHNIPDHAWKQLRTKEDFAQLMKDGKATMI